MAKRTPKKKSPKQVETWGCLERMIQMITRSKCVLWLVIAFAIGVAVGAEVSQFLETDSANQIRPFPMRMTLAIGSLITCVSALITESRHNGRPNLESQTYWSRTHWQSN
jgi:uncharacterized membrane protein YfcA